MPLNIHNDSFTKFLLAQTKWSTWVIKSNWIPETFWSPLLMMSGRCRESVWVCLKICSLSWITTPQLALEKIGIRYFFWNLNIFHRVSSWLSFFTSESSSHFLLFPISGCLGSPSNHTCSASWWQLLKIVLKKVKIIRWTELTNAQTTAILLKIINKLLRPNELVVLRWLTRSPTHSE